MSGSGSGPNSGVGLCVSMGVSVRVKVPSEGVRCGEGEDGRTMLGGI